MIRPVYAWPKPATSSSLSVSSAASSSSTGVSPAPATASAGQAVSIVAPPAIIASNHHHSHHHTQSAAVESSSKLKRHALMFLSTIRVSEEEALKKQLQEAALIATNPRGRSESGKQEEILPLPLPPSHMDSGWGARMRGDVKTQYILASNVRTDKPHRLFLSWDRAYPALVISLVLPAQPTAASSKNKTKSATLALPKLGDDGEEEAVDASDDDGYDNRGDSSSEDGDDIRGGMNDSDEDRGRRKHHSKSFAFLLDLPGDVHKAVPQTPPNGSDQPDEDVKSPSPRRSSAKKKQQPSTTSPQQSESSKTTRSRSSSTSSSESGEGENNNNINDGEKQNRLAWDMDYSFEDLDDSRIIQGKHRVVQNLPSARISIIPYIKTKVLKEELNSVFREQHPDLPQDLTLSMLRKLKREMLERAKLVDCELCTVAMAYVYFEKLVLKGVVHKANRKRVAFTCLFIAFKFNESGLDKLKLLLQEIERVNNVSKADIFASEFAVFAHLRFNLMLPGKQYFEHFVRLMRQVDVAPSEYLGETHDEVTNWFKALAVQEKVSDKPPRRSSLSSTSDDEKKERRRLSSLMQVDIDQVGNDEQRE